MGLDILVDLFAGMIIAIGIYNFEMCIRDRWKAAMTPHMEQGL